MGLMEAVRGAFGLLFNGDPVLWRIVWISVSTSVLGLLIAAPFAVAGGYAIAMTQFRGRRVVIWLVQAALSLPTVLIGLLLYMMLSRHGPMGGLQWLFSQPGIVAGQVVIALPVLLAFTLAAVQAADPRFAETAIAHGASPWRVMSTLLYEVRFGVMAAIISGFGRVISEVGCAMMVGGNIAGETRTITTAIALETSKGEFAQGIALGVVLVTIALAMNGALVVLQGDAHAARGAGMTPMLSIARLTKRYGEHLLFDLQDFRLDAARAYVLTGMNGAGKSTLLRVLAGLAPADAHGIHFAGEAVTLAPYPAALRRDIVYVHQHPVMFSTSVAGNIGYGLKARGVARDEASRLVDEAMHWAGVLHLRGSQPATLSGGEKQRVALARAKVLRPRLLLLDEPTASLDGEAREQVLALIPSLTQSGSTVVMACHDRDLINLPDVRRLKLRDGQLEEK